MLRVLVCGGVDDGKSTLVGNLLLTLGAVPEDRMERDPTHLTDGLEAEREQGITIDVAHRRLDTGRRRIHLLDCPGHVQYVGNMATAASQAELALLLVDAAIGPGDQTRRHALIARMMGVRAIAFIVNKMDLVDFSETRFLALRTELDAIAPGSAVLPACAVDAGNLIVSDARMPWYRGATILGLIDAFVLPPSPDASFRFPVQLVLRDPAGGRLHAGTVAAGRISLHASIAAPGGPSATIRRIRGPGGDQQHAAAGDAVAIVLDPPIDAGRGTVLADAAVPAATAERFRARMVWCGAAPMLPGRRALFKLGTASVPGTIARIHHGIDVATGLPAALSTPATMEANDVAVVDIALIQPIAIETFAACPPLGRFIVVDPISSSTIGAGIVEETSASTNLAWQPTTVEPAARAALLAQRPTVLWFTGLSGAGKTTLANRVEALLHAAGRHTMLLDGDNLRHGLCADLGFAPADRVENVRRVGEVAALMAEAGLIVLVCLISPYRAERAAARARIGPSFHEIFVDAPLETCRQRDPKGLYAKADRGDIPAFTGVSAPYEPPETPESHIRTHQVSVEESALAILRALA